MRRILPAVLLAVTIAFAFAPQAGAVTNVPTLTSPVSSSTHGSTLAVSYTLPDTPASGSVRLFFSGSASCTVTMADTQVVSTTLSLSTVATSPSVTASTCASIPDGTYTVTLAYQNAALDPAANVSATNVVINTSPPSTTTTTTTATTTTTIAVTTTTTATTTTVPGTSTTTAGSGATTTTSSGAVAANGATNGGSGAPLASTGSSTSLPLAAISLGLLATGLGAMVLRRRR